MGVCVCTLELQLVFHASVALSVFLSVCPFECEGGMCLHEWTSDMETERAVQRGAACRSGLAARSSLSSAWITG